MSFMTSFPIVAKLNASYHSNNVGSIMIKNATLCDLIETLGNIMYSLQTTDKTIPPQVEYNRIVIDGLEKLGFFKFIKTLELLTHYEDEEFAFCSLLTELGRFPRPTKEEFQEFKQYYVLNTTMELMIDEVFPVEIVRAIRLHISQLLFRFFHTYDVNATRELVDKKEKKTIFVCDPENATYRVGDSHRTSTEFMSFMRLIVDASQYLSTLDIGLSDISGPFKTAAMTAKKMREDYKSTNVSTQNNKEFTLIVKKDNKYNQRGNGQRFVKQTK